MGTEIKNENKAKTTINTLDLKVTDLTKSFNQAELKSKEDSRVLFGKINSEETRLNDLQLRLLNLEDKVKSLRKFNVFEFIVIIGLVATLLLIK